MSARSQMSNVETRMSDTNHETRRRSSKELFVEHRQFKNGMSSFCLHRFCVYLVLSADVGECRGMSGDVVASLGASAWTSGWSSFDEDFPTLFIPFSLLRGGFSVATWPQERHTLRLERVHLLPSQQMTSISGRGGEMSLN